MRQQSGIQTILGRHRPGLLGAAAVVGMLQSVAIAQPSLRGLGTLPGVTQSFAFAISANGSTIVGNSGPHAFRWTESGGMQDLGVLPGGQVSVAWSVSADGAVVVGEADNSQARRAFRWTA